jgi:hypothetical protein
MFEKIEKIKKACPVCGKEHTLIGYHHKQVWLDGQPKLPMEKYLARYGMCEQCGCVYKDEDTSSEYISSVVNSQEYQEIWQSKTEHTLKKILLMQLLDGCFGDVHQLLAHYYDEHQQPEKAHSAICAAINQINNGPFHHTHTIITGQWKHFRIIKYLYLHDDMYIIDLYRRANQMNEALARIRQLRGYDYFGNPVNIMNYLAYEEDLIKAGNTKQY